MPRLANDVLIATLFLLAVDVRPAAAQADKPKGSPVSAERRMAEFRTATTAAKLAILKQWARTEAIPRLGKLASEVDPKYVGVRNLGKALKGVKPDGPIDEAALSDANPDYWRAMLEMAPGFPLNPAVRIALHTANGEIDAARRIARTFAPFDQHKSPYSTLIAEFSAMADPFAKEVDARIKKGIALHDAGKLDQAIAAYDGVLKDYPGSALAYFERHQSRLMQSMKANKDAPDWAATRKAILQADPLYGSMAEAGSEDELYDLLLRKETEELFKDKAKGTSDLLRLADISVDLGQYGYAAMIYWNLMTNVKPADYGNRDLIEATLYCFERLGAKELKKNFKGDHAAAFLRIDAERAKRKQDLPALKAMKSKD
jgi:tetratricopeptide (TPR) repeat protein